MFEKNTRKNVRKKNMASTLCVQNANLEPIIRPRSQLQNTRLHIVGEKFNVNSARGLINSRRLPNDESRVVYCSLCHQCHFIVAIGAAKKKLLERKSMMEIHMDRLVPCICEMHNTALVIIIIITLYNSFSFREFLYTVSKIRKADTGTSETVRDTARLTGEKVAPQDCSNISSSSSTKYGPDVSPHYSRSAWPLNTSQCCLKSILMFPFEVHY